MENREAYNFKPEYMLEQVSCAVLHFAQDRPFQEAVSESGYYRDGEYVGLRGHARPPSMTTRVILALLRGVERHEGRGRLKHDVIM